MHNAANPVSEISSATVETAARLSRISMDSAERVLVLQLDYAKTSLDQAAKTARALARVKDLQELISRRTRHAQTAVQRLLGYSRSLYPNFSGTPTPLSQLDH